MAHGQGDRDTAVAIATATAQAILQLPKQDQRLLSWTIVESSLGEAARKAFEMLPQTQQFLSESQLRSFAKGQAKGMAEAILKLLAKRDISMTDSHRQRILDTGDLGTLDDWFDRALTVTTMDELFT
jgi:hypothetical protein